MGVMSLTKQQALDYFHTDDLIGLGMEADALRRKLHPEDVVTYAVHRKVPYTKFAPDSPGSFALDIPVSSAAGASIGGEPSPEENILSFDAIFGGVSETLETGGTAVLLHGEPNSPD